jgi:succinyl-diaminopimelate desuccinylase
MPQYPLDDVLGAMREICGSVDAQLGTKSELNVVQRSDAAPPTSPEAPVVNALKKAVKTVYGVDACAKGIGGGTVAALIRRKGFGAAVWARMDETMHGANEYVIVDNLLGDAKVFANVLLSS